MTQARNLEVNPKSLSSSPLTPFEFITPLTLESIHVCPSRGSSLWFQAKFLARVTPIISNSDFWIYSCSHPHVCCRLSNLSKCFQFTYENITTLLQTCHGLISSICTPPYLNRISIDFGVIAALNVFRIRERAMFLPLRSLCL